MLYSFQHNFLFTHEARTGGVSLGQALQLAAPMMRTIGVQHAPLVEAQAELGPAFDEVFKFAFVRNPWDRLASYRAFLATVAAGPEADPQEISDPDAPHWQEFEGFLAESLAETVEIDGVPRPVFSQFHQLADADEVLLCDHIGRFERLEDDAQEIFGKIDLRTPPLGHQNRSERLGYAGYFNDATREMVEVCLAKDVRAFGYRFDGTASP